VALGRPGDVNQALMDLSAKVCLPKEPRCLTCPLAEECTARREGRQREIPTKKAKAAPVELRAEGWILLAGDELLLARRPTGQWLSGLWDIPWWIEGQASPALPENCAQFASCAQTRTITKHRIHFEVRGLRCEAKPVSRELAALPATEFRWVRLEDLHGINLPRPSEKALAAALRELE